MVEIKGTIPTRNMSKGPKTRKIFVGGIPKAITNDEFNSSFVIELIICWRNNQFFDSQSLIGVKFHKFNTLWEFHTNQSFDLIMTIALINSYSRIGRQGDTIKYCNLFKKSASGMGNQLFFPKGVWTPRWFSNVPWKN